MLCGLPLSSIAALQSKNNTKLIASTQIHAFNNEDSSARIGQRVPVRTAQFVTGNGTTTGVGGVVSDVINYEQVGLTLKFKPIIFPNQDVQVAMEIESKDVSGAASLTPIFTERTIKGTARIQNNKTLLLASVAQNSESNGRQGLPLLGLIPILGRLFTAPTRDNRQVDIVIAVTPRVIRAPAIIAGRRGRTADWQPCDADKRFARGDDNPGRARRASCRGTQASERRRSSTARQKDESPVYVKSGDAQANAAPAGSNRVTVAAKYSSPIAGSKADRQQCKNPADKSDSGYVGGTDHHLYNQRRRKQLKKLVLLPPD